ncbi:MAG: hypothetical protein NC209_07160 [Alistipes sp.]|nr:hypothetical protein [Alistipes senegalensis]MCM1250901.1 hypothetical protein [Alistipes sp.]
MTRDELICLLCGDFGAQFADRTADAVLRADAVGVFYMLAAEILESCRSQVPWVAEAWDDLIETQAAAASPAIRARLRNSWKSES